MRRVVIISAVALLAVGLSAAAVILDRDDSPPTGAASSRARDEPRHTATSAPPTTTTTRPRRGSGQPITFAFGGDVHFEGSLRAKLAANPGGMFAPIAPELAAADVAMVNLESAITERGTPDPKSYNFRAPARALDALRAAGIDLVTEANNHGRDYGPVGLLDTLAAKAASGYPLVGIGANATEAYAPWRAVVRGQRIAVLGASDVIDDALLARWTATDSQPGIASAKGAQQGRLLDAVRAARADADTVVVYLHWGAEGISCPTGRQKDLTRALVEAGADIVVGSHSHRVMTAGRLGTAVVDYGLGNFAFYNEAGPSGITGVLSVTATGRDVDAYSWKPARIQGGIPHLLSGASAAADVKSFDARRACTDLTP